MAGTRNSSMGPPWEIDLMTYRITDRCSTTYWGNNLVSCNNSCTCLGAGRSSEVECSLMVRWVVGSILHGVDPFIPQLGHGSTPGTLLYTFNNWDMVVPLGPCYTHSFQECLLDTCMYQSVLWHSLFQTWFFTQMCCWGSPVRPPFLRVWNLPKRKFHINSFKM